MPKHMLPVNQPMSGDRAGPDGEREGHADPWAVCWTLQADEIAGAARYERSDGRKTYRAGHYECDLTVKAGKVSLRVPKLKGAVRVDGHRTVSAPGGER